MSFQDSLNSFEADFENFFVETEADVQALIALIQKDAQIAEAALTSALSWIARETPTVVPIIEEALTFASAVGAASNPEAAVVIAAAQEAVSALNAVAQAQNSGASDIQTLLAGYTAVKQAQAAGASVVGAAAKTVLATTARAPSA